MGPGSRAREKENARSESLGEVILSGHSFEQPIIKEIKLSALELNEFLASVAEVWHELRIRFEYYFWEDV